MRKITFIVPDFPEDEKRRWHLFSGIEERARLHPDGTKEVKTVQCDGCGKCCMEVSDNWAYGKDLGTGWCAKLYYDEGWKAYRCEFHIRRPWACCAGDWAEKHECAINWEKQ